MHKDKPIYTTGNLRKKAASRPGTVLLSWGDPQRLGHNEAKHTRAGGVAATRCAALAFGAIKRAKNKQKVPEVLKLMSLRPGVSPGSRAAPVGASSAAASHNNDQKWRAVKQMCRLLS